MMAIGQTRLRSKSGVELVPCQQAADQDQHDPEDEARPAERPVFVTFGALLPALLTPLGTPVAAPPAARARYGGVPAKAAPGSGSRGGARA